MTWAYGGTPPSEAVGGDVYLSEIEDAFGMWAAFGNISFAQGASADIDLAWAPLSPDNELGLTSYSFDPGTETFISAQIQFNVNDTYTNGFAGSSAFMLVAEHEIGHALGLGHFNDVPAVMNAVLNPSVKGPTQSDIDGIQAIYGVSPEQTGVLPAVGVELSMYGAPGSATEIAKLQNQFLPPQIAVAHQIGVNAAVFASETIGLALSEVNEVGSTAFADRFGPAAMTDAEFVPAAVNAIFGAAATANLDVAMAGFLQNWEHFYSTFGAPGGEAPALAARGAAWGDAVGVALVGDVGPLVEDTVHLIGVMA